MKKKAPSRRIEKAEENIKKAVSSYLLFNYDFPSKAGEAITFLEIALESLLAQAFFDQHIPIPKIIFEKVQEFWDWDDDQKRSAHWLRKARNNIVHPESGDWEEKEVTARNLQKMFELIGGLYTKLGYEVEETFSKSEVSLLKGEEPKREHLAEVWANAALDYCDRDPEAALLLANDAILYALRAFARCWRIDNAGSMTIPELIIPLNNIDYFYDHKYFPEDFWNDDYSDPFYLARENGGWDWRYLGIDFNPPMTREKLDNNFDARQYGLKVALRMYVEEVHEATISFIARSPDLDFYESLLENWDNITTDLRGQFDDIEIPAIDRPLNIFVEWDECNYIGINLEKPLSECSWTDEHVNALRRILIGYCGNPSDNQTLVLKTSLGGMAFETYDLFTPK